jgi:arginine/serine-rich splicing factor 4/5/6
MGFGLHDDRDERSYGGRGGRAHPYARGGGGGGGGGGGVSGNRVFVHNLAFKTSWQDLKDHARQASAAPIAHTAAQPPNPRAMGRCGAFARR